jgi:hypothetical protein
MIDESAGQIDQLERQRIGARTRVMDSFNLGIAFWPKSPVHRIRNLGLLLRYGLAGHHTTKRRIPVDVQQLAADWVEAIALMCTSHDKDGFDAGDARADKLLSPLLAAPIKQVREFYGVLLDRLKSDPRVPFLVWIAYEAWGEAIVKNAPDEGVKRLKRKLAADIADLVEQPVAEQIPRAIARALCWRDEEQLKDVKAGLKEGAKPKLVGRQSCLFLEVGRGKKKVSVMV